MNTKIEKISDTKIKMTIELSAEELKPYVDRAYMEVSKSVKIPGFRPGKAPKFMIEKEVGSELLEKYILEEAVPGSYYEAILKESVVAVGSPNVKVLKFVPSDGLSYEAEIEVMPEFKLPDLSKIKVQKEEAKVEKKEIDESLEYLREMLQERKEASRPAKEKDRLEIDFEGSINGVPFEGGKSENHPVVIGSKSFIPGFEEELVGMKKGEEKEFEIEFPKDYGSKEVAGKKAKFKVKVKTLEEITLPELDDEFAGKIGPFKSLDELKKDIEQKTKEGKESQLEKALEDQILTKVSDATKIEAPKSLIHEEVHRMVHEAEHNLAHSGLTLDAYLEHTKKSREDFEKELEVEAAKRVKIGLILSEVVKEQKLELKDKEIADETVKLLEGVIPEKKEEASAYYNSPEGKRSLENALLARKAMAYIKSKVQIETK